MIQVDFRNEQTTLAIDAAQLRRAIEAVLSGEGVKAAEISLAVIDDAAMHILNRRYLNHDEPTDVLSFVLEARPGYVEGEIIVSADTATSSARRFGWSAESELLLYVIHGALHLVGYDDLEPEAQAEMRQRERAYLGQFGLTPRYAEES
ncbi:MAG TPA: rRNA maturation RNase YbeY [Pirellulales bacterium]|nr:rRNA maturation RNase YbeY [Pirellulales bacterium]